MSIKIKACEQDCQESKGRGDTWMRDGGVCYDDPQDQLDWEHSPENGKSCCKKQRSSTFLLNLDPLCFCLISPLSYFCSLLTVFCHCFLFLWSSKFIARAFLALTHHYTATVNKLTCTAESYSYLYWGRDLGEVTNVVRLLQKVHVLQLALHLATSLLSKWGSRYTVTFLCLPLQESHLHCDAESITDVAILQFTGEEKDSWQVF